MSQPAEKTDGIRFSNTLFGRPECLPVPAVALLLVILYRAGADLRSWTYVYEPPWLLFCLNSVFITGLCLIVAGLSVRIYLRGGFVSILLLGCGVLAFGLSSSAAGWLIRPPHGPNEALTIHNSGVLFASVCFFLSSLSTSIGKGIEMAPPHRAPLAGAAYLMVLLSVALLAGATMLGSIPPFFIPGEGPTALRQAVLAVSVTLLAVSAALMLTVYAKRPSGFLLYTVVAILLLGMGLVGIALGPPGSPINWLGRVSQYLGNVYLVMAAVGALREAKSRGTTVEQALAAFFRTSETHFKALVEMAADAIVSIDGEGKILLMNPAAGGMFGYGTREAVGRNLGDLIVPEPSRELFQACLRGEPGRSVRMDLRNRDGSILPVEMSFSPETRAGAGVARTIVIRDVTERKKAEEAVQSASLFPIQNPQPVLRVGGDGAVLFSNPAAERILAQWRDAGEGPVPDPVRRAVLAALKEGVPKDLDMHIAGRDFSFVVAPIPGGPYANLYGWDVTDRRRAEEELRASEMRMKAVADHLPVGVWFADETGRILYGNEAGRRIWGGARYVEPSEFHVYRAWWADTGTPLAPEDWAVSRAVQKGETSLNEVIEIECFDGTRKTILNSAVPLKSPDGSLRGVVVLNEDITERVRAEQALQSARDELEEKVRERTMELMLLMEDLEKSRSDLRRLASELVLAEERERKRISVVLHDEVAQTLAATKMRLDLLRNMPGSDDFHRTVSEAEALIGESIRQTRALMTDITNPVLYDMGLRAAVEALAEDVSARRGIDFACRFAGNLADLGQELDVMIFQVIKELVQNIVKHSGARSAGIRIAEEGKDVRVTVTDDGEGFDAAQIGPAGSEGGFGLFSIRERVKSYGGRIEIDSAPGNGSRVSVVLPKTAGRETRNGGKDRIVRP